MHPDVFNPDLALSLNNLRVYHSTTYPRPEEGLWAIEQAVELYRSLAKAHPEEFIPDLARSLSAFAIFFYHTGHQQETLRPLEEAIELRRSLATERPKS